MAKKQDSGRFTRYAEYSINIQEDVTAIKALLGTMHTVLESALTVFEKPHLIGESSETIKDSVIVEAIQSALPSSLTNGITDATIKSMVSYASRQHYVASKNDDVASGVKRTRLSLDLMTKGGKVRTEVNGYSFNYMMGFLTIAGNRVRVYDPSKLGIAWGENIRTATITTDDDGNVIVKLAIDTPNKPEYQARVFENYRNSELSLF
jgi:hypothetical protein